MGRVVRVSRWKLARLALRWLIGILLVAAFLASMGLVLAHERNLPCAGVPAAGLALLSLGVLCRAAVRHILRENRRQVEFSDEGVQITGDPGVPLSHGTPWTWWIPWGGVRGGALRRTSPLGGRSLILFTDLGTLELPDRFDAPLSHVRRLFLARVADPCPSAAELARSLRRKWPSESTQRWLSVREGIWLGLLLPAWLALECGRHPHIGEHLWDAPSAVDPSYPLSFLLGFWLFMTMVCVGLVGLSLALLLRSRRRWALITPEIAVADWDELPAIIPIDEVVRVYDRLGPSNLGGAVALRGGAIVRCHPQGLLAGIARRAPIPEAELWRRAGTIAEWNQRLGASWLWGSELRQAAREVARAGRIGGLYRDIAVRWMLRKAYFRAMDQAARRIRRMTSKPDPPKRRRIAFEDEEIDPKPLPAGPVAIKIAHRYWRWPPPQGESAVLTFLLQEIEREGLPAYEICVEAAGVRALPLRRLPPDLLEDGIDLAAALCAASGLDPDRLDCPQGARLDGTLDSVRFRFLVESGPTADGVRFTLRRPI